MHPSAVVRVNHAIAMSYAQSVERALALLQTIEKEPGMQAYQSFYVARADLHSRLGKDNLARSDFEKAIKLSDNKARSAFLKQKLESLQTQ